MEPWKAAKIGALFMAAAALTCCHSLPAPPAADAAFASQVKAGNIADGKAHVYVFLGRTHGLVFDLKNRRDADFYVNGQDIGKIAAGDCLYFELEPGVYNFSWAERAWLSPIRSDEDVDLLSPNQDAYLALDVDKNAGSLLGLAGEFFDPNRARIDDRFPAGRYLVSDLNIILPKSDVASRIHPLVAANTNLPPSW